MLGTEPRRARVHRGKKACTLSAGLKGNPSLFDGKKLSLVGLDIHFIDVLPSKIAESIKTIYLSNNYLANLTNLDQFLKVESASIMNNNIRYLDELQTLSRLKNLRSLSLQGNVVSKMPFYREHLVCMCPSLTLLDDEKITPEYRSQCQQKLLVISTFYDYLRVNELRNSVLVHICKMMECHAEIRLKFGKENCFSHSLQTHFKDALQLDSGAGTILQVALQGGVFCWLQRMDCRHFNRLVQDNLYDLLAEYFRQNPTSVVTQGPELSQLWQGLVEIYKKDQFDFYSQIIAFCALLRSERSGSNISRRKGGAQSNTNGSDNDGDDGDVEALDRIRADHCLCRMQLLSTPCPMQCMQRYDSDRWRPSMAEQRQLCRVQHYQTGQKEHILQENAIPPPPPPPLSPSVDSKFKSSGVRQPTSAPLLVQRIDHRPPQTTVTARTRVQFVDSPTGRSDSSDAYNLLLDHSKQQQELVRVLADGVLRQSRAELLMATTGLAEQRLKETSHSELVSERYDKLLNKHQNTKSLQPQPEAVCAKSRPTAKGQPMVLSAGGLSRHLPPQQIEPEGCNIARAGPTNDPILRNLSSDVQIFHEPVESTAVSNHSEIITACDSTDSVTERGNAETPAVKTRAGGWEELSVEVDSFLARSLQPSSMPTGETVDEDVVPPQELLLCQELETRWLLAAEEIEAHLSVGPQAEDMRNSRAVRASVDSEKTSKLATEFADGNMRALRMHIDKTMFDQLRRAERDNAISHMLHRSLVGTLSKFQEHALSISDAAVQHLSVRTDAVRRIQKDIRAGAIYLQAHEESMGRLEEMQGLVAEQRSKERVELLAEAHLLELLEEQTQLRCQLEANLSQGRSSLAAVREEEKTDVAVVSTKINEHRAALVAAFYPTSLACVSLKKHYFHMLRARTTRQRRINTFCRIQSKKRSKGIKQTLFTAWQDWVHVVRRGKRLQRWKDKSRKFRALERWLHHYHLSSQIAQTVVRTATKRTLRTAFTAFLDAARQKREVAAVEEKHALYVTLFYSIRVFRAWKKLTQASCDRVRVCLAAARRNLLRKCVGLWAHITQQQQVEMEARAQQVQWKTTTRTLSTSFVIWGNLLQYRSRLGQYRRMKRAFLVLHRRIRSQRDQQKLLIMAAVVATSPHGLMQRKLVLAWKCWFLRTARKRYFRRAALMVEKRRTRFVEYGVLCAWHSLLRYRRSLSRKKARVMLHCCNRTLQNHFAVWKAVAVRRKALVPELRERWLNLFDEHSQQEQDNTRLGVNSSSLLHSANVEPAVSFVTTASAKSRTQLRQSLSMFELQLLYWDDEEDDEGCASLEDDRDEEVASRATVPHAQEHGILLRRYLGRWHSRAACMASLQFRFCCVQKLVDRERTRKTFSVVLSRYGLLMLQQKQECDQLLQTSASSLPEISDSEETALWKRRSEIDARVKEEERQQSDLRRLADSLTLALTSREQELDQMRSSTEDVSASIAAIQAEKEGLERRVGIAKEYIQSMAAKRDRHLSETSRASEQDAHLPSLLARLTSSSSTASDESSAPSTALRLPDETCSADERLALMQDVEALYREAVCAQEGMVRRKQHLANQRQAAETLLEQRRLVAEELDQRIETLEMERSRAEHALRSCQLSLDGSFSEVADQTRDHEAQLTSLENEEKGLRERLLRLAEEERTLSDRVDALQALRQHRGLHSADGLAIASVSIHTSDEASRGMVSNNFSPRSLGKREALVAEHLSHIAGATGTFRRLRHATDVNASHISPRDPNEKALVAPMRSDLLPSLSIGKENRLSSRTTTAGTNPAGQESYRRTKTVVRKNKSTLLSATISASVPTVVKADQLQVPQPHPRSQQVPQEDIDKQIEALSLRIRQRLTTI